MLVTFLFADDHTKEFRDYAAGVVPAHRLFGAAHVGEYGASERHFGWPSWWPQSARRSSLFRMIQALRVLVGQRKISAVVCATEASAPPILLMRRLRLLRKPVVVLTVAVLKPANLSGIRKALLTFLLHGASIVFCYSSEQVPRIEATFGLSPSRIRFIPMGVDVDFFPIHKHQESGPDVLSVGTNPGKDMATLIAALPENCECLVVTDAWNAAEARAVPTKAQVSFRANVAITELRELYASARHVVIPLRHWTASSGQTVLLENLVSGRVVVASDVPGIADYTVGTAVLLVPVGDEDALRTVLSGPALIATTEQISVARELFNSREMTQRLVEACHELTASTRGNRAISW